MSETLHDSGRTGPPSSASLLDLDRELAELVEPNALEAARARLIVALGQLPVGPWTAADDWSGPAGGIGLLVVEGFLVRRITLGHRSAAEILGPGDIVRPWQDDGRHEVYPFESGWRVTDPATLAVLDRSAALNAAGYPEVISALVGRALGRSRRVVGHLVLAQFGAVEHRILLGLWHLADDWGRVRNDGILLPISLTHEMLGLLVGARRPAVTTALGALERQGAVSPAAGGGFVLTGEPPSDLPLLRGAPAHLG